VKEIPVKKSSGGFGWSRKANTEGTAASGETKLSATDDTTGWLGYVRGEKTHFVTGRRKKASNKRHSALVKKNLRGVPRPSRQDKRGRAEGGESFQNRVNKKERGREKK